MGMTKGTMTVGDFANMLNYPFKSVSCHQLWVSVK